MNDIFTKEQKEQIVIMYKDNVCIDNIISALNSNEHFIRAILKENQIDRRYNTFTEELNNRVISLYQSGKKMKDICYDLLISAEGINKILARNKIEKRTYSENNTKYYRDKHYFDIINTPNKAYVLGLIYADGCNYRDHNSLTICLQEDDKDLLEKVRKEIQYEGNLRLVSLREKNERYKNQYVLCINDEYISEQLETLGVVKAKSLKLEFPTFLDKSLYSHFVRGYFDGDGCTYYDIKRNKCRTCMAGTYEFCQAISSILNSFGCKNNIYHPKQSGESNTYILQTSGNKSSYLFLSWIYKDADIKMDRKYKKYIDFCNIYLTI